VDYMQDLHSPRLRDLGEVVDHDLIDRHNPIRYRQKYKWDRAMQINFDDVL